MKAASDIFAPVSGTITEVNENLEDQPGLLNKSAEQDGAYPVRRERTGGIELIWCCLMQDGWPRLSSLAPPSLRRS